MITEKKVSIDLKRLINENHIYESGNIEYKRARNELPRDFWKTYSAFANTTGGYIILGITENDEQFFEVTGVLDSDHILNQLFSIGNNPNKVSKNILSTEDIEIDNIDGKTVIIIHIPEVSVQEKPIFLNNELSQSYIRKHSGDYKISTDELAALLRDRSDHLDYELLDNYTIEDLDIDSVERYKFELHKRNPDMGFNKMDDDLFLQRIGVLVEDRNDNRVIKMRLGGLLFFGKYEAIKSRLPHYHVDYFDRRGETERWRDRVDGGNFEFPDLNLYNYFLIVYDKLSNSIERPFELDTNMIRKTQVDIKTALREAFVNMIIHADYLNSRYSLIAEVYDLYYSFKNPGAMKISKSEFFLGSNSRPRNTLLVNLFTRLGAAEHAGSGSQKIIKVVKEHQFSLPEIDSNCEQTSFKLWVVEDIERCDNLTDKEKLIYKSISQGSIEGLSKSEIQALHSEFSLSQLTRVLDKLVDKKLIIKQGGNRNRTYARSFQPLEAISRFEHISEAIKKLLLKDI